MASLSNCRWQNRKESPNQSTNNGGIVFEDKRDVVSELGLGSKK